MEPSTLNAIDIAQSLALMASVALLVLLGLCWAFDPDGSYVSMLFIARPSPMVLYVPPFDATDVRQKAMLAHELTHFLQSQSPAFVAKAQKEPCWAKSMEPPAYGVNFAYARLMAEDPEQLFHGTLAEYVALFADCATVARLREQGQ